MPRQACIDAPGALHHIIIRGIERTLIFTDDRDRENFLERLSQLLPESQTPCYAWALMSNHAHLLLRTGRVAIASLMRRLLTGYAVSFNKRHRRHGHLFENRYKSILCEEDRYLRQLVAYIHLNPLRAGIVEDLAALKAYPFTGHSALMGQGGAILAGYLLCAGAFWPQCFRRPEKSAAACHEVVCQGTLPRIDRRRIDSLGRRLV
jgi:REP element-mobilizing transposase RayT